ncbi:MAG: FHA domain-containing protein [Acidobacteria bacterium]|nr:MAG: FHA domain-containing protein [Acidobacteriota bacterium]
MAYRIRAKTEDQTIRVTLHRGRNVVGSDPSCEICLQHPTVSRRHAAVTVTDGIIEVEDLGSRNGTLLRSQPIERAALVPGDVFVVGRAVLTLEEVEDEDLEVGIGVARAGEEVVNRTFKPHETTQIFSPLDRFSLDFLPQLLEQLLAGVGRERFAQQVGAALFDALAPAAAVEVIDTAGARGVLFAAEHAEIDLKTPQWIDAAGDGCQVRVLFPSQAAGRHFRPIIQSAALLVSLSGRRKAVEPAPAPRPGQRAKRPSPPSVVPEVQRIYDQAERVARGDVGILIFGESGTGKEVLARFIHAASPRAAEPLVAINCASLPRDLLEAELFGVERGVATGVEARAGRFEQADKGTIFLDEIGDMAPETQAKILRVLQEREVFRIGSHTPRPARARVIAATNRPIHKMLADGTFRGDLYHRIATWEVELPPLRRRRADIPSLAAHFLSREAQRYGIHVPGISRAALRLLSRYRWPGNIRQLRNEISRAALFLEDGELLDTERLSPAILGAQPLRTATSLAEVLEEVERDEIRAALEVAAGDTAAAAARLKISRPTLYRRIKNLGLEVPKA